METLTTLKTRGSCRAYKADHVEEEKPITFIKSERHDGLFVHSGDPHFNIIDFLRIA